jgi:hypothetical protein
VLRHYVFLFNPFPLIYNYYLSCFKKSVSLFHTIILSNHCPYHVYGSFKHLFTLRCFTVRNSQRCSQCVRPLPPLPPHPPHHHRSPPMCPQDRLHFTIAKAVCDAYEQALQEKMITHCHEHTIHLSPE